MHVFVLKLFNILGEYDVQKVVFRRSFQGGPRWFSMTDFSSIEHMYEQGVGKHFFRTNFLRCVEEKIFFEEEERLYEEQ